MIARIIAFFTEFFISKMGTCGLPTGTLEQLEKFKSLKALSFPQKKMLTTGRKNSEGNMLC